MGSVTRRTLAAVLVAAPALAAAAALPGSATAFPYAPAQQGGEAKVGTTNDFKFDPVDITVAAGTKVTWTNTGGGYHTVTGGDGVKDPSSPMQGVIAAQGDTYSATFPTAGTFKYYCEPHLSLGMVGTVTVTAGGAPAVTATAPASAPAASSAPPASASASATVGAPQQGAGAPTNAPEGAEGGEEAPGIAGNKTLESIEAQRAAHEGAVSGFRFFAAVATAFLVILGAAVLFSTRPRRAGR